MIEMQPTKWLEAKMGEIVRLVKKTRDNPAPIARDGGWQSLEGLRRIDSSSMINFGCVSTRT